MGLGAKPARVLEGRLGVVDAARAHDDEQPVVVTLEDRGGLLAMTDDLLGLLVREREALEDPRRGGQRHDARDAAITDAIVSTHVGHGHGFFSVVTLRDPFENACKDSTENCGPATLGMKEWCSG